MCFEGPARHTLRLQEPVPLRCCPRSFATILSHVEPVLSRLQRYAREAWSSQAQESPHCRTRATFCYQGFWEMVIGGCHNVACCTIASLINRTRNSPVGSGGRSCYCSKEHITCLSTTLFDVIQRG